MQFGKGEVRSLGAAIFAVCVQVMCGAFGVAEKLPPAMFEAASMSGLCGHEALGREVACGRFNRALSQVGVWPLILACLLLLCACR